MFATKYFVRMGIAQIFHTVLRNWVNICIAVAYNAHTTGILLVFFRRVFGSAVGHISHSAIAIGHILLTAIGNRQ